MVAAKPDVSAPGTVTAPAVTRSEDGLVLAGVVACFFLSGFAALLYQTAWLRQFSLVFGTSELAVATVLAAYMGGLALGAAVAGKFIHRVTRPVLAYGLLEAGIAISALAVPLLLAAAGALYVAVLGDRPDPPDAATIGQPVFYLFVAFIVLAIPTGFMGATLPLLIRHVVTRDEDVGPRVALLYATNTAGAVGGTVVAGFLLLPAVGLNATVWVGVFVNAVVFAIAALLARSMPTLAADAHGSGAVASPPGFYKSCIRPWFTRATDGVSAVQQTLMNQPAWILPLMLVSGANAFLYEVLWTRMLSHVLGGSIYAFATMLAAFLTGIALGGAFAGRFTAQRERAPIAFAITQVAIALLSVAIYWWMGALVPATRTPAELAIFSVAVMLPATIFIGATFPIAVRMLARDESEASVTTARIYSWNTVGSIIGAIAAGFYLIPLLGFEGAIKLAVLVNLVLALWVLICVAPLRRMAYSGAVAGLIVLTFAAYWPNRPQAVIASSGFLLYQDPYAQELYFAVGRSSTVLLTEESGYYNIRTNGLPEASISVDGAPPARHSQRWLTALPVAARPDARNMMVIGFGGGVALEGAPPSVEDIDVVELEPEVVNANRVLSGRRAIDPLAEDRVNIVINDARNALRLTNKQYDVIVSQPSHPWTAGASHLFTREFVALAREHLTEDGVFLQWMNSEFVDADLLRSLAATLADVFEYVRLYQVDPTVLQFLASDEPLDVELDLVRTGEPLRSNLLHYSYMGLNGVNDFVAALALDEAGIESFSRGARLSTDNYNLMATRSRVLGDGLRSAELAELLGPYDALLKPDSWIYRELGDRIDLAYIASRLFASANSVRAAQLADATPDFVDKAVINALGYAYNGAHQQSREAYALALSREPNNQMVRFKFIADDLPDIAMNRASEATMRTASGLTGVPAAIVAGWPLGAQQDWAGLVRLDEQLSRSNVSDIWYPETILLRAEWRTKVAGEERQRHAFNALRMVDRALVIRPDLELYVLRAAAALALEDREAFVESGRYVALYIQDKLARARQGTYVISDYELDIMQERLTVFDTMLKQLEGNPVAERRGREVEDVMRALLGEVQQLARERGIP